MITPLLYNPPFLYKKEIKKIMHAKKELIENALCHLETLDAIFSSTTS
jgi:hypothetical protein